LHGRGSVSPRRNGPLGLRLSPASVARQGPSNKARKAPRDRPTIACRTAWTGCSFSPSRGSLQAPSKDENLDRSEVAPAASAPRGGRRGLAARPPLLSFAFLQEARLVPFGLRPQRKNSLCTSGQALEGMHSTAQA